MTESSRIGLGSCPICASPKAHFTLSKKQLVCVTCNACNVQIFARSERSDELIRAKIAPPAAVSVPSPVAAAVQEVTKPEPEPTGRKGFMSW